MYEVTFICLIPKYVKRSPRSRPRGFISGLREFGERIIWRTQMSYTPNLKDPRTQKRVKKAIGFTNACIPNVKPKGWLMNQPLEF